MIIENMGVHDQSQVKIKFEKFKKSKTIPKMYQKVITMTSPLLLSLLRSRPLDILGMHIKFPRRREMSTVISILFRSSKISVRRRIGNE